MIVVAVVAVVVGLGLVTVVVVVGGALEGEDCSMGEEERLLSPPPLLLRLVGVSLLLGVGRGGEEEEDVDKVLSKAFNKSG